MNQKNYAISMLKNRDKADLNGWEKIGCFGHNTIYMKNKLRRIVEKTTGRVVIEYSIPMINGYIKKKM